MSMKKNALAAALVAGLSLAGAAAAYTIQTNGNDTAEKIATSQITNAAYTYTMTEAVEVSVDELDFIVGRTTGFNVRIELNNGARFGATDPTVNLGDDLPAGWGVVRVAGGAGSTFIVYSITPPSTGTIPGIEPGELFNLTAVQVTNLTALQTPDATIVATARFIDAVGASEIGSDVTNLLQSGNPVQLGCDASAGDQFATIDVGQEEGGQGSKTYFSSTGEIGALDLDTFDFGDIVVTRDAAFPGFEYAGTDTFTSVITGDFSAFAAPGNSLYLTNGEDCDAPAITATTTINPATNTATFSYTAANAGFGPTGGTLTLCGRVADGNTTVIDAVANPTVRTTFTRAGVPSFTGAACALEDLTYNGSVVRVYHVNPAGNTTAQSFVRVINQSNTAGRVTIAAIDDAGNPGNSEVSFDLGPQQSMQVNSDDLENGNAGKGLAGALGDGAGKWRLFVTGEFSGMVVQSLNRNATDGTVTNLTDADTRGEQLWNDVFESNPGL